MEAAATNKDSQVSFQWLCARNTLDSPSDFKKYASVALFVLFLYGQRSYCHKQLIYLPYNFIPLYRAMPLFFPVPLRYSNLPE